MFACAQKAEALCAKILAPLCCALLWCAVTCYAVAACAVLCCALLNCSLLLACSRAYHAGCALHYAACMIQTVDFTTDHRLLVLFVQALQDKLTASSQKIAELETQLSAEHERAVSAEERSRTLDRQLAEQQQESAQLAKKREDSEAELEAQGKQTKRRWRKSSSLGQLKSAVAM